MRGRMGRGFTLIELLFVVATIAVLAAISVPNFLEAQVRSKIARAKADNAVLVMGLSRYYADHGAYPPNDGEARRYLEAALQHPVLNDETTSQPADVKVGWFRYEKNPDDTYWGRTSYGREGFPALVANPSPFFSLTTPVAYLESAVPGDPFGMVKEQRPVYINSYELFASDKQTSHPGLWGDHLTSETFVMTGSVGPDGRFNFWHPLNGPWITYDATNGTASDGDFLYFEGRRPSQVVADPTMNPETKREQDMSFMGGMI